MSKGIQIKKKTLPRFYFLTVKMAIIKKTNNNTCWQRCKERGRETIHCWGEYKLVLPVWKPKWTPSSLNLPWSPSMPLHFSV